MKFAPQIDSKYVLMGIVLVFAALVFFIVRPFIGTILASFVLAYMFYPVYKFIRKFVKSRTFTALLVSILIIILFTVPLIFIANSITKEARVVNINVRLLLATINNPPEFCEESDLICKLTIYLKKFIDDPQVNFQIKNLSNNLTDWLTSKATEFVFSVPVFILQFFIMLFILYYLLKEGDLVALRIRYLLPLKKIHSKTIFEHLNEVTFAVIYGHIVTAGIQAIIGTIGFFIFGVTSPILWGLIMFFAALIPFLGTPIVWVPLVISKAITHEPISAFGLLVTGLIVSTIDNLIKPKIISGKARVHPVLVLLGVVGGLLFFGPVGIIVGPVILSIAVVFIEIYEEEKSATES